MHGRTLSRALLFALADVSSSLPARKPPGKTAGAGGYKRSGGAETGSAQRAAELLGETVLSLKTGRSRVTALGGRIIEMREAQGKLKDRLERRGAELAAARSTLSTLVEGLAALAGTDVSEGGDAASPDHAAKLLDEARRHAKHLQQHSDALEAVRAACRPRTKTLDAFARYLAAAESDDKIRAYLGAAQAKPPRGADSSKA